MSMTRRCRDSHARAGTRVWRVTGVHTCVLLFSSRRRHTRLVSDWSSDLCSSDLFGGVSGKGLAFFCAALFGQPGLRTWNRLAELRQKLRPEREIVAKNGYHASIRATKGTDRKSTRLNSSH